MTSLLERPADVAALRSLLARAKAAGWTHYITDLCSVDADGKPVLIAREHSWKRGDDTVELDDVGNLTIEPSTTSPWHLPVLSADQVGKVLEAAGVLPVQPQPLADPVETRAFLDRLCAAMRDADQDLEHLDRIDQAVDELPRQPAVGDRVVVDPDRQSGVVTDVIRDADGEVWEYDVRLPHGQVVAAQPGHVHPLPAGPHAGQPGHRWEDCPDLHTGQHPQPGDPALPLPADVEGYPLGGELVEDAWPDPNHRGEL